MKDVATLARQATTPADAFVGGGAMGRLIRESDWSASPLGPPGTWSQSLRTTVGMMLAARAQIVLFWGPDFVALYNDAYAPTIGDKHPRALGRPARENWSELWDDLEPLLRGVRDTGETFAAKDRAFYIERHGYGETVYFDVSYSAVPEADGSVGGVLCIVSETTKRVLAERQQAFELALADIERGSADAVQLTVAVAAALGREIGAARVGYGEVDDARATIAVARDWTDGSVPSLAGEARMLDGFGPAVIAELRAGRTLVVDDFRSDPRAGEGYAATWESIGTRSLVVAPLVRDGRLRAVLYAHEPRPRRWSAAEVALVETTALRTWGAVERARAEERLRQSEARLRVALDGAGLGTWDWDLRSLRGSWSPRAREILGVDGGEDVTPERRTETIHPDDRERVWREFAEAVQSGGDLSNEYRVVRPDGAVRWIVSRGAIKYDEAGAPLRASGVVLDVTDQRLAERAAAERAAHLSAFFEQTAVGMSETDATGRFVRVNDCYCEIVGRPREELLSLRMQDITHPEDLTGNLPLFRRSVEGGGSFEIEKRYLRPDGSVVWVHNSVTTLRDADGRPLNTVCVTVDITAQKTAETRLRELNHGLAAEIAERTAERDRIWQLSPDLMCVARVDGTLLSVNPAWERLLGWSTDWLTGRNAAEIKHPDDAERTAAELARLAAGDHRTVNFEDRYRTSDGSWRWISWVIEPEGELIYCIGRDVTAVREASADLAESRRRLATLLDNLPGFAYRSRNEPDRRREYMSEGVSAIVGRPPAAFRGPGALAWADVIHPDDRDRTWEATQAALGERRAFEFSYRVLDREGNERWVRERGQGVYSPDGGVEAIEGFITDITDQRLTEEALRQSRKLETIGQLTGGLAHDFNNLLTVVTGNMDMARRSVSAGDEARAQRAIANALKGAESAGALTRRLLAFARRQPLAPEPVDANELVDGMSDLLSRSLGETVTLRTSFGPGLRPMRVDRNQLESAILNLAVNARDAMPDGGSLAISTANVDLAGPAAGALELVPGAYVEVSVADTGTGMSPEVLARAVEPFFTTKAQGKGTGLGLSQVYGFAKQSGGSMRIDSRAGGGTTVRLFFPVDASRDDRPSGEPGASPERRGSETVLLVEDQPDVADLAADMLTDAGYRVLRAATGEEGLRRLDETAAVDLVFSDIVMPGSVSGIALAREVRRRRPGVRVLLTSGYSAESIERADEFPILSKPYRRSDLLARVREVLDAADPPT